jgi:hypothetical protein
VQLHLTETALFLYHNELQITALPNRQHQLRHSIPFSATEISTVSVFRMGQYKNLIWSRISFLPKLTVGIKVKNEM